MFPDFNFYSSTLLFLSLQGLLFALLLFKRYFKAKSKIDLLLALILTITFYNQVCYCLGFLGWYDTYKTTKINYFFFNVHILLAPLIFFYVRMITKPHIKFSLKDLVHFIPFLILLAIKAWIFIADSSAADFNSIQNGLLVENFQWDLLDPIVAMTTVVQMSAYMFLSFKMLKAFREKIRQYFSNAYQLEMHWLYAFTIIYSLLFLYHITETIINDFFFDLHWTQEWYYYLLSGIALIYMGIKGYFTDLAELKNVDVQSYIEDNNLSYADSAQGLQAGNSGNEQSMDRINAYMTTEKPYLDPKLTLVSLAKELQMTREQLSQIINSGFGRKFNSYVNQYRIEEFKTLVSKNKHKELSILGLAYECGFNSKATFNRAFKNEVQMSPSTYIKDIDNQ